MDWGDGALAVLLRQFIHACDRGGVESKSEQRLRSLGRHPGGVGFNDLLQDFAFGIKCGRLAHGVNIPRIGRRRQDGRD